MSFISSEREERLVREEAIEIYRSAVEDLNNRNIAKEELLNPNILIAYINLLSKIIERNNR